MSFSTYLRVVISKKFIISLIVYEMFQKFATLGFQSVLFLFLKHEQKYTLYNSIGIYHAYVGVSYLVPIIGTIIAELYMNKVMTILLISYFAVLGQIFTVIVSLAVVGNASLTLPFVVDNSRFFLGFGLLLRALGIGGVREVGSSMSDDHFNYDDVVENGAEVKLMFQHILYYFIVIGTIVAFILPPALRQTVQCFDKHYCYPVAVGVSGVGMLLALVFLMTAYVTLEMPSPKHSIVVEFFLCIKAALSNMWGGGIHWVDNASYAYTDEFLDDVKLTLHVLTLFIPLPIFWALFEQMGSQWVAQGTQMNTTVGLDSSDLFIEPEQMQVFNPLFVLVLFPVVEYLLLLALKTPRFVSTTKQRLFLGSLLAVVAFVAAGYVEYRIEPTRQSEPKSGEGEIIIFNTYTLVTMEYTLSTSVTDETTYVVPPAGKLHLHLPVVNTQKMNFTYYWQLDDCHYPWMKERIDEPTVITLLEKKRVAVAVTPGLIEDFTEVKPCESSEGPSIDMIYTRADMCDLQLAKVGFLYFTRRVFGESELNDYQYPTNLSITMRNIHNPRYSFTVYLDPNHSSVDFFDVMPGTYQGDTIRTYNKLCHFRRGGTYIVFYKYRVIQNIWSLTNALDDRVRIWWQLPQYFLISIAEYLFPLTLLEYSLSQTTERMKPVVWNFWLLTIALGNFLVAIFSFSHIFERQFYYYVFYTCLMGASCMIVFVLLFAYLPVELIDTDSDVILPPDDVEEDQVVEPPRRVTSQS